MTNMKDARVRVHKRRKKSKPKRKTYELDSDTLGALSAVQTAMGAMTEVEAVRKCIRLTGKLVRHAKRGAEVQIVHKRKDEEPATTIIIDVPGSKLEGV